MSGARATGHGSLARCVYCPVASPESRSAFTA